jgi:hypothetical protein
VRADRPRGQEQPVADLAVGQAVYRAIYLPWTLTDSTAAGLVEDLFRPPSTAEK